MWEANPEHARNVRLRQLATRETVAEAAEYLSHGAEVLPAPNAQQSRLEGEFFLELRYLHAPSGGWPAQFDEFSFHRLRPRAESLEIIADRRTAARAIVHTLPATSGDDITGIPGVRLRTTRDGVALRKLGAAGEIRFPAVTEGDVLREVTDDRPPDLKYLPWTSPDLLTSREVEEIENVRVRADSVVEAASAVARRVGVLVHAGATSIDMWTSADRLSVEAWFDDGDHLTDRILEQFASPDYEPRMRKIVHDNLVPPRHYPFEIGRGILDLRLRSRDEGDRERGAH